MSRILKLSVIAIGAALIAFAPAPPASAAPQRGVVVVRGAYGGGFYGRGFYGGGFYGPGFYGPGWGWYGGWYGPGWYGPRAYYGPRAGQVKIDTKIKGNSVYVDGGFAGVTGKLKKFPLKPGNHDIEVRDRSGHAFYQERVHVIPGKTIKIYADQG